MSREPCPRNPKDAVSGSCAIVRLRRCVWAGNLRQPWVFELVVPLELPLRLEDDKGSVCGKLDNVVRLFEEVKSVPVIVEAGVEERQQGFYNTL